MRNFFEKMLKIDRRWIFLFILVAVSLPLVFNINFKTGTSYPVENVYNRIEEMGRNGEALFLQFDYTPSTAPELYPMCVALIRHAFVSNVPLITMTFYPTGAGLIEEALGTLSEQYGKEAGVDYVNFGYKTPPLPVLLGMGEDLHAVLNEDTRGVPVSELPMLRKIHSYQDIGLLIDITGASMYLSWVAYARGLYGQEIAAGITAVSVSQCYPLLDTGQLIGLLPGLRGAAEYEQMVDRLEESKGIDQIVKANVGGEEAYEGVKRFQRNARIGMDAQAIAHLVILVFIVLGNIGYFITRKQQKKSF